MCGLVSRVLKQNRRSPCEHRAAPIRLYGSTALIFNK
jgi:hypothetical protein